MNRMAGRLASLVNNLRRRKYLVLLVVCGVYVSLATGVYYAITEHVPDVTPEDVRHLNRLLQRDMSGQKQEPQGRGWLKVSMGVSESLDGNVTDHMRYSCDTKTNTEDLLCDVKKPKFLPEFKNPCWRVSGRPLWCLPYFQLIGADKCGTTDLFSRLIRHPHVVGNLGYLAKETSWWAWKRYGLDLRITVPRKNFKDYVNFFREAAVTIEETKNAAGKHVLITGDGSPMDFWDFRGWTEIPQNVDEPVYLTPQLIRHVNPDTKFIIMLRDPVERLYSDYHFLPIKRLCSPESFHGAVSRSFNALSSCLRSNSLRHCLYDRELHLIFNKNVRLHIGFYVVYLTEWLKVFPRHQILILRFENYITDVPKYLNRVFRFLELDPVSLQQSAVLGILNPVKENETKKKVKAKPMLNETIRLLKDIYEPFNIQLANILSDEQYLWP